MAKKYDLTGQRFGRLTVLHSEHNEKDVKVWVCQCDCGNIITDTANHIINNRKSCGCRKAEGTHTIHHGKHERLYHVWSNMKQRCSNPNLPDAKYYIDKGITVCEEWNDYAVFREWAMENGYDPSAPRGKTTIDRIDGDKGYNPENCRIVDAHIQRINQNRPFEHTK